MRFRGVRIVKHTRIVYSSNKKELPGLLQLQLEVESLRVANNKN